MEKTHRTPAPHHDSVFARRVAEFCRRGHTPPRPSVRQALPSHELWMALHKKGTTLWLDTGDLEAIAPIWTREFQAVTTNNTLLNKEVQKGVYDSLVPEAAAVLRDLEPEFDEMRLVEEIAFVLNAVHGLKLVRTFDADVSVELHTNTAHDIEAAYQYGKRFHAIEPDRFIVKVPLTPDGILAARRLRLDGIRVNFTLGFSARQNYLIGRTAQPTWVNVFLGRCNSFVADSGLDDGRNVGEKTVLASQRTVEAINTALGTSVRQIAASLRSGQQVVDLAGVHVMTIPTPVAQEFLDLDLEPAALRNRSGDDPAVVLSGGRTVEGERLDVLWTISPQMKTAVERLSDKLLDQMNGNELRTFLADYDVHDLFPALSAQEEQRIAAEGKIPKYETWRARVRDGSASWDGLLTQAALASFTADQKKLDDRIRQNL